METATSIAPRGLISFGMRSRPVRCSPCTGQITSVERTAPILSEAKIATCVPRPNESVSSLHLSAIGYDVGTRSLTVWATWSRRNGREHELYRRNPLCISVMHDRYCRWTDLRFYWESLTTNASIG